MKISLHIDPVNDTLDEVQDMVDAIFSMSGAMPSGQVVDVLNGQVAPQSTGTPAPPPGALDTNGTPWDARIHVTPAKQSPKGAWISRRGLDPQVVAAVKAELAAKAQGSSPAPVAPPAAPPAPVVPAAPAPIMPPAPQFAPPPIVAPTVYEQFVRFVGENMHHPETNPSGRLTNEYMTQALTHYAVPGGLITNLAGMGDEFIGKVHAAIKQALGQ